MSVPRVCPGAGDSRSSWPRDNSGRCDGSKREGKGNTQDESGRPGRPLLGVGASGENFQGPNVRNVNRTKWWKPPEGKVPLLEWRGLDEGCPKRNAYPGTPEGHAGGKRSKGRNLLKWTQEARKQRARALCRLQPVVGGIVTRQERPRQESLRTAGSAGKDAAPPVRHLAAQPVRNRPRPEL